MKEYQYYVSYVFKNDDNSFGVGSAQISRNKKIKSFRDIQLLNMYLSDTTKNAHNIVVINFKLLGRSKV